VELAETEGATVKRIGSIERLYRRLGVWYVAVAVAATALLGLAGAAVAVLVEVAFLTGSLDDAPGAVAAGQIACVVALVLTMPTLLAAVEPVARWLQQDRPAGSAEGVWRASMGMEQRLLWRMTLAVILPFHFCIAYVVWHLGLSLSSVPAAWLTAQLGYGLVSVVVLFMAELLFRPLIRDVARFVPPGAQLPRPGLDLRRKQMLGLVTTTAFTGLAVSAVIGVPGADPGTQLLAVSVVMGVTVVLALPILLSVNDSVLSPVNELIAGTARVAAGDLGTPVPVVTTDELGQLGASFNRMLEGLREREALRSQNTELDAALGRSLDDVSRQAEALRESRTRIVAASDAARRQVERDLHDGAQQHLVLLNLKLAVIERTLGEDQEAATALGEARRDLDRALAQLRDLAHGIYPVLLESDGLAGALGDAVERSSLPASLAVDGAGRYAPEVEAAVYFCCLEALQNAAKHGGHGARVAVTLEHVGNALQFSVADDGPGFDPRSNGGGTGLQNMTDRIGALGGEIDIASAPGEGTVVRGMVPAVMRTSATS
jgi:signal transduction histidine kinase